MIYLSVDIKSSDMNEMANVASSDIKFSTTTSSTKTIPFSNILFNPSSIKSPYFRTLCVNLRYALIFFIFIGYICNILYFFSERVIIKLTLKLFGQIIGKIAKTNTIKKILEEIRNLFLPKDYKISITTEVETAMAENLIPFPLMIIFIQIYFVCIILCINFLIDNSIRWFFYLFAAIVINILFIFISLNGGLDLNNRRLNGLNDLSGKDKLMSYIFEFSKIYLVIIFFILLLASMLSYFSWYQNLWRCN